MWEKPGQVVMAGDSQCTIAALEKSGGLMQMFFTNRTSEIARNFAEAREIAPMEDIMHVPGEENPADIPTRGEATKVDLRPGSIWLTGPAFLHKRQ